MANRNLFYLLFGATTGGSFEALPLDITPTTEEQIFQVAQGGYSPVKVAPVETEANPSFTENGTFSPATGKYWTGATVNVPQSVPEPVATEAAMDAKLVAANEEKAYLYTGTTGKYTQGNIYVVEASA